MICAKRNAPVIYIIFFFCRTYTKYKKKEENKRERKNTESTKKCHGIKIYSLCVRCTYKTRVIVRHL